MSRDEAPAPEPNADGAPESPGGSAGESAGGSRTWWRPSRRGFLIGLGVAGAGVALGWRFGLPYARLRIAESLDNGSAPGGIDAPPDAWFEVLEPGAGPGEVQVRLFVPKVEMGQGIHTALGQIAAEELELPLEQLEVRQASTLRGIEDAFGTGASNSVASLWTPLREAAATLRTMLAARAAERWGVPPGEVAADGGRLLRVGGGDALTFAEAAAGAGSWEVPDAAPPLKARRDFRVVGRSSPRVDLRAKLTGEAVYGLDQRVEGMAYGAVARPPVIGATLASAAPGDAAAQPGVIAVVIEDGFAGVVADSRSRARRALERLELTWTEPDELVTQARIDELTTVEPGSGVVIQRHGSVGRNLGAGRRVEAEYRSPMAAHAHLEPQSALADARGERVTVRVATQSPTLVRNELAEMLGRPNEEIEVVATYLGGGFGRRLNVAVAGEAVRLSAAAGVPVHLAWTREEEFRHGYVRPPTHSVLRAALTEDGRVAAFEHEQASGDVAFPFFPAAAAWVLGADFGAWRGAPLHYGGVPHRRVRAQRVRLPVATGWWRGLGLLANVFANESFIDELAHAAGADPLDFRLAHLDRAVPLQARAAAALERAAAEAGWGEPLPEGRARGVAWSSDVNTVVAQVAEVSLAGDRPRVHRVTVAMDPGLVINPDGARAQAQGSVMMGLSSALHEELTVADGSFAPSNFDSYPLLRITEAPEVDVHLLESGDEPFGVGEPPLGPVAAAVGNALFALTGERVRRLPLRLAGESA